MADLTIITNNVPRLVLEAYELTQEERNEFDYINWNDIDTGNDSGSFIRYKGELYDLNDIERSPDCFPEWHGFVSDSFFSGILIRYCDCDYVVMGRYYC